MKYHLTLLLSLLFLLISHAQEGVILAETSSGKIVRLDVQAYGTEGSLGYARLSIHDGKKLIFSDEFKDASQFAEELFSSDGKALIILKADSGKSTISLSFKGKYHNLPGKESSYKSTLLDKRRKAQKGNFMSISIHGEKQVYEFKDIIFFRDEERDL